MQDNTNIKKTNYFLKLYRGDIPLFISFWLWFIALGSILRFSINSYYSSSYIMHNNFQANIDFAITLFSSLFFLFIFLSVYRSAMKYEGSKFNSFAAKVLVLVNLFFLSASFFENNSLSFISQDEEIKKEIQRISKTTPLKINTSITLTKASIKEKTIFYTYKLLNFEKEGLHGINKRLFKDEIIQSNCENIDMKRLVEQDYTFSFEYKNKKDKSFSEVNIDKKICQNLTRDLDILKEILAKEKITNFLNF